MNFQEAAGIYTSLKARYESGAISRGEFDNKARSLVAVAPDGKRWGIDPASGAWSELGALRAGKDGPSSGAPQTLLQFIKLTVKGMVKTMPKIILIGLVIAVLTWVYHTYLVAKVNDGLMVAFGADGRNSVMNLQQNVFPGVFAFWGLLAYFLKRYFMKIVFAGPKAWIRENIQTPVTLKKAYASLGKNAFSSICLGIFLAMLLGGLYQNYMLSWVLAAGFLIILTSQFTGLEIMVVRLGLGDLQRMTGLKILRAGKEFESIYLGFFGMAAGFLLAALMGTDFNITLAIALIFLLAFCMLKFLPARQVATLIAFALTWAFLSDSSIFAWCEGGSFSRAGGTWLQWWGSDRADLVRQLGLGPASSALGGSVLGGIAAGASSTIDAAAAAGFSGAAGAVQAVPVPPPFSYAMPSGLPAGPPRMVGEDGKEYVFYKPLGDTAEGPFWCPVELYEQDQWHNSQGHVFQDNMWHPDQEIADMFTNRRENPPETWYRPEEEIKRMREADSEERIDAFVKAARENPHNLGKLHETLNDEEFVMAQERLKPYKDMLRDRIDISQDLSKDWQGFIDHAGRLSKGYDLIDRAAEKGVSTLSTTLNMGKPYGVGTVVELPYRLLRNYGATAAEKGEYWIGWEETAREGARSVYQTGTNMINKDSWGVGAKILSAGAENIGEQLIIDQQFDVNEVGQALTQAALSEGIGALANQAAPLFDSVNVDTGAYFVDGIGRITPEVVTFSSEALTEIATIPVNALSDAIAESSFE